MSETPSEADDGLAADAADRDRLAARSKQLIRDTNCVVALVFLAMIIVVVATLAAIAYTLNDIPH